MRNRHSKVAYHSCTKK